ncbi:N,N-dimethylformamidase beta subunit family domain-containing protein [Paraburkholderia sp. MPAMCS5]|uniref:N,N-dimethylformamidase beta subunit family domain-containing protein n=1 Tax=Paraburkholderia sp. MPAMCS5 TaxID=3112563 RepID=UPI002E190804|nr:N,N-dimethylformamidase beta subunit family domain-containing protein [Paraburkholderia sp. MPAMCS5]
MQIYPIHPSFTAGSSFELAVQPKKRFSIAIYQQLDDESITSLCGVVVTDRNDVTSTLIDGKYVFQSAGTNRSMRFDEDWKWPTITIRLNTSAAQSGAYVAVAYEVDAAGKPTQELGRQCAAHQPLLAAPPACDSMALVIARPRTPTAALAYIIPTATYHAYNSTGGGSFYDDRIHRYRASKTVSLRRPGGGLGARLGEPVDPYDTRSQRQQFAHWDAKFIRWLRKEGFACDFYTDLDLHNATALDLTRYRCMLSVGHHEYWSEEMRAHVAYFLTQGGNLGVFSGNTCYRPVRFIGPEPGQLTEMRKLAENWDVLKEQIDLDPRVSGNESHLIGLTYKHGGGHWGTWSRWRRRWVKGERAAIGFTVRRPEHWAFAGTQLRQDDTFGADDRIVGYEADGIPPDWPQDAFETLAVTNPLTGWEMGGSGAIGIFRPVLRDGRRSAGEVFNVGTTDWARALIDTTAKSHDVVQQITRNVIRRYLGVENTSQESHSPPKTAGIAHEVALQTDAG